MFLLGGVLPTRRMLQTDSSSLSDLISSQTAGQKISLNE